MDFLRLAVVFFALLLFSCSNEKVPDNQKLLHGFEAPLPELMRNDEGIFRGISLGMTMAQVRASTGDTNLTQMEPNYLLFEDSLGKKDHYTYDFSFDSLGLKEINIDVYQHDSADAQALFDLFKGYFTKKYGEPSTVKDLLTWEIKGQKRSTEVALLDQSIDYGYGKLTIIFYDKHLAHDFRPPVDSTGTDSVKIVYAGPRTRSIHDF